VKPAVALLFAAALAFGGCENNQERSARLERQAKQTAARNPTPAARGLTIDRVSSQVQVVAAQTVHDGEGAAVIVTLRNGSAHTLRDVPIAVTVKGAHGGVLYRNDAPGLEAALTSVPVLAAGRKATWIDDQLPPGEAPASVSTAVGEAPQVSGAVPQLTLTGVHPNEEGGASGIAGTVHNGSAVTQKALVVYGLARRGAQIVAAGRAVLSEVPAHGAAPFQVLLIGSAAGAKVEASAAASTF